MNNVENVSAGKPSITGAIWIAPLGTTLPEATSETLNEAFKCLGYCSDDGLTNASNMESSTVKAWGGDTVLVTNTSKEDQYKYTLIEATNVDVLKHVYGESNVSGDLDTGIILKVNNHDLEEHSIVIDMILRNNTTKRVVIPSGKVAEVGDVVYNDSDPIGYETTLVCLPDEDGFTHYEYIKKATEVSA